MTDPKRNEGTFAKNALLQNHPFLGVVSFHAKSQKLIFSNFNGFRPRFSSTFQTFRPILCCFQSLSISFSQSLNQFQSILISFNQFGSIKNAGTYSQSEGTKPLCFLSSLKTFKRAAMATQMPKLGVRTRVLADVPLYQKLERGYIQMFPCTKTTLSIF